MTAGDNVSANAKLALMFVGTSMLYLMAGVILIAVALLQLVPLDRDAVFVMELYGFVAMMIFGLTYIFIPGLSHSAFADNKKVKAEFALLNVGIIALTTAMSGLVAIGISRLIVIPGLIALGAAVALHSYNLFRMIKGKK